MFEQYLPDALIERREVLFGEFVEGNRFGDLNPLSASRRVDGFVVTGGDFDRLAEAVYVFTKEGAPFWFEMLPGTMDEGEVEAVKLGVAKELYGHFVGAANAELGFQVTVLLGFGD